MAGEELAVARSTWACGWPTGCCESQAFALRGGRPRPLDAAWWNRQTRLVRFGCTRSRDIWVHADVPAGSVDEREVDRVLGLVAEAAVAVRGLRRPQPAG